MTRLEPRSSLANLRHASAIVLATLALSGMVGCKATSPTSGVKDITLSPPALQALFGSFKMVASGTAVTMNYRINFLGDGAGNLTQVTWQASAQPNSVGITSDAVTQVGMNNDGSVDIVNNPSGPMLNITSASFLSGSPVQLFQYENTTCSVGSKGSNADGTLQCQLMSANYTGQTGN